MIILHKRKDGGVSLTRMTSPELDVEAEAKKLLAREDKFVSYRLCSETDVPASREFRDAWVDELPGTHIDISCEKAKDIQLAQLRIERNAKLDESDKEFTRAMELDLDLTEIKAKRQALRDVTEPLKALDVTGKLNDAALLAQIRDLGTLKE